MQLNEDTHFKGRDRRTKDWFSVDNSFLNGYAKKVGSVGQSIYLALCRHSNKRDVAYPSLRHLSKELGISIGSVSAGVNNLLSYNIIKITKSSRGLFIYYLLDKSEWKKISRTDWSNLSKELKKEVQ